MPSPAGVVTSGRSDLSPPVCVILLVGPRCAGLVGVWERGILR